MDWLRSENDSSADGSDGDESIAASHVESVHSRGSYVRSRPQTHRRVSSSPPGSTSYGANIQYHTQYESPPPLERRRRNVRIHLEEEDTDSQISDDPHAVHLRDRYTSRSISQGRSRSPDYLRRGRRSPSRPYSSHVPYYSVDSRSSSPSGSLVSSLSHSAPHARFRPEETYTIVRSHQAPSKAPSYHSTGRIYANPADASDDEHIKVHHIINLRPSHSIYGRNDEQNLKFRSRVFTHQPSFKHEEAPSQETYRIVHTRLIPGEDEHIHDIAVLTYDEGAAGTETETRWIHLQSNFLSLELLEIESLRLDNISEVTCTLIRSAFRHLRQRNEKPYVNGRYLDPTALSFVAKNDEKQATKECSVAFFALPYFALEPLRRQEPPSQVSMHPVRSLLQFHYSFHPTGQRDEKQVVCNVLESPEVIHIPQTWMLLINGDLILSMGPSNLEALRGNVVNLEKMAQADSGPVMLKVRVIDLEGKEYCLPKTRCRTWFELMTMFVGTLEEENFMLDSFLEDSWRDQYELRVDSELVSEESWPKILRERDGEDVIIHILMKPLNVGRHYYSRPAVSIYDTYRSYDGPNHHRHHSYSTRASSINATHIEKQSVYSMGNRTCTNDMIRHPAFIRQRNKENDDSIRQHHADAIQRNAWKSDKKPIRLKDLAGFELMIPWRVGRTWRKMESVIGTKMQCDREHLRAFATGAYTLHGPDGPITPADWNVKISPGWMVELRLKGSKGNLELVRPRHASLGFRSQSRAESSSGAADQPFTPAPLRRVDTDHQIELPGFAATRGSTDRDLWKTSEGHDEPIIIQHPESTTTDLIPAPEKAPILCRQPPTTLRSSDSHVSCWDMSLKPSGHGTEPNSTEENDQHLGMYHEPVRRTTDLQRFVEDIDEYSFAEKGSSLTSMTAIISPVEDLDLGLRESVDKQSLYTSFGPNQPAGESIYHPISEWRASSSHSLTMSNKSGSPDADYGIEKPYPERAQLAFGSPQPMETENDSNHTASLDQMGNSNGKSEAQLPSGIETLPQCPIFAWKLEATDGLPSTPSEKSEPIPDQYKDMDKTIRAILEERDAEANLYFLRHERENDLIDSLSGSSRIEVLVRMKMIGHAQNRSSDAQYPVRKISEWKRIQDIINNAIEVLDAFVPVHYQNLHQYWLIKKFFGALMALLTQEYPGAYLDFIGQDISYFCKNIRQIHAGITRGGDKESTIFYLPKALVEAFNPLITYVCICSQIKHDNSSDLDLLKHSAKKVHKSLRIGKYQLIAMLRAGDFSEAKVFRRVNAQDIITMVTGRLVSIPSEKPEGPPGQDGFNLLQIYRRYISRLELQVRMDPNAETFDAIQRLREELSIVNTVLDQQLEVLEKMKIVWTNLKQSNQQISLQSIHQSRKMIKQMKRDSDELEDMAGKTSMLLRSMIEVRKESNSSAITIFTIVTVIFLPLSFITSYLGMNSVDIRNGTFHQSLFWAISLPSAAFLIFILWVVIRFRHHVRRVWPRRRLKGSLRMIAVWLYGAIPGAEAPQGSTNQN